MVFNFQSFFVLNKPFVNYFCVEQLVVGIMSKIPTRHLFGHASLVQNQMNYNSLKCFFEKGYNKLGSHYENKIVSWIRAMPPTKVEINEDN
jgi:hypothetical protein